jgi:hypothetical protein
VRAFIATSAETAADRQQQHIVSSTNAFLKTTVCTNVSVLDFTVHYLLHVSAPIGGHLQVKCTQKVVSSAQETLLRAVVLRNSISGYTYLLTYSVALVRKRTIPAEWPPLVGEVSANFCG